jgi:hypothetical protein
MKITVFHAAVTIVAAATLATFASAVETWAPKEEHPTLSPGAVQGMLEEYCETRNPDDMYRMSQKVDQVAAKCARAERYGITSEACNNRHLAAAGGNADLALTTTTTTSSSSGNYLRIQNQGRRKLVSGGTSGGKGKGKGSRSSDGCDNGKGKGKGKGKGSKSSKSDCKCYPIFVQEVAQECESVGKEHVPTPAPAEGPSGDDVKCNACGPAGQNCGTTNSNCESTCPICGPGRRLEAAVESFEEIFGIRKLFEERELAIRCNQNCPGGSGPNPGNVDCCDGACADCNNAGFCDPTIRSECTEEPSETPSAQPSVMPSAAPSAQPSAAPTGEPSATPSASPTGEPSESPSAGPSISPTILVPTPPPTAGIKTCVTKLVDPCNPSDVIGFCQETITFQPSFTHYGGKDYEFSTISGVCTIETEEHAVTFSYFYADNPISNHDKSLHYIDGIVNGGNSVHSGFTLTLDQESDLQVIYLCENAKVKDEECGLPKFPDGDDDDDDDDDECSEEPSSEPSVSPSPIGAPSTLPSTEPSRSPSPTGTCETSADCSLREGEFGCQACVNTQCVTLFECKGQGQGQGLDCCVNDIFGETTCEGNCNGAGGGGKIRCASTSFSDGKGSCGTPTNGAILCDDANDVETCFNGP